jgi:hypothetical protein
VIAQNSSNGGGSVTAQQVPLCQLAGQSRGRDDKKGNSLTIYFPLNVLSIATVLSFMAVPLNAQSLQIVNASRQSYSLH